MPTPSTSLPPAVPTPAGLPATRRARRLAVVLGLAAALALPACSGGNNTSAAPAAGGGAASGRDSAGAPPAPAQDAGGAPAADKPAAANPAAAVVRQRLVRTAEVVLEVQDLPAAAARVRTAPWRSAARSARSRPPWPGRARLVRRSRGARRRTSRRATPHPEPRRPTGRGPRRARGSP